MRRVFITISALILVAGGGFAAWHYHVKQKSPSSANTSQNSNNYLVIKEWGVRFKTPTNIGEVSYHFGNTQNSIIVTTPELLSLSMQDATCSEAKDSIIISRAKPGDDRFGSPWTESELANIGKKVADFYYYFEAAQSCFNQNPSKVADQITSIKKSIQISLNTLEESK